VYKRYLSQRGIFVKMHLLDHCDSYIKAARKTASQFEIEKFVNFYCGNALLLTEAWIKNMRINMISTTAAVGDVFDWKMLKLASAPNEIKLFLFSASRLKIYRYLVKSKRNPDRLAVVENFARCNIAIDDGDGETRSFKCIDFEISINKENRSKIHEEASEEFRFKLYDSIRRNLYTEVEINRWLAKQPTKNMYEAIVDERFSAINYTISNPILVYEEFVPGFTFSPASILSLREKVRRDLESLSDAGKERYIRVLPPVIELLKFKLFGYLNEKQLTFLQPSKTNIDLIVKIRIITN